MKKIVLVLCIMMLFPITSWALTITSSEGGNKSDNEITLQNPYAYEQFYTGTYVGLIGGFGNTSFDGQGTNSFTYKATDGSNRVYSTGTKVIGNVSSILPAPKGPVAGIYAGYGYQTNINLYFAGEALFYFLEPQANVTSTTTIEKDDVVQNSLSISSKNKEGQEITLDGRIGYVVRRRFLLYTKFGYRLATFALNSTFSGQHVNLDGVLQEYGPIDLQPTVQLNGITAGIGFEYPIPIRFGSIKFTMRNELMYTKYFTYTVNTPQNKDSISSKSDISVNAESVLFTVGLNILF